MEVKGNKVLKAQVHEVWLGLNDPQILAKCTPGCELLDPINESQFRTVIKVGVAAVSGTFQGIVTISDVKPDESYNISVEASSTLGFTRISGVVTIAQEGLQTKLSYAFDATIGGLIAGVGQRILGGVARRLVEQFFTSFEKEIAR